jgi:hypothetical protein
MVNMNINDQLNLFEVTPRPERPSCYSLGRSEAET